MAEKDMFICDLCLEQFKDVLDIEQKPRYQQETCAFCNQKKEVKWSRVTYGKKRER